MVEVEAEVEVWGFDGQEGIEDFDDSMEIKRAKGFEEVGGRGGVEDLRGEALTEDFDKVGQGGVVGRFGLS